MAKGGGSANKTYLYQQTKAGPMLEWSTPLWKNTWLLSVIFAEALLNPKKLEAFIKEKLWGCSGALLIVGIP